MSRNDEFVAKYLVLANRLSEIATIERNSGRDNEPESETLAHALVDIDEVCRNITRTVMPRLMATSATDSDILDALTELGELFRELLYHVRDPYHFRYLPGCENGNNDSTVDLSNE